MWWQIPNVMTTCALNWIITHFTPMVHKAICNFALTGQYYTPILCDNLHTYAHNFCPPRTWSGTSWEVYLWKEVITYCLTFCQHSIQWKNWETWDNWRTVDGTERFYWLKFWEIFFHLDQISEQCSFLHNICVVRERKALVWKHTWRQLNCASSWQKCIRVFP